MDCPRCGEPMICLKWNPSVYIMVCDNGVCECYRRPGPVVSRREVPPERELGMLVNREASPGRRGRRKAISPEEFTDDEGVSPTIESLRRMRQNLFTKEE